MTYKIVRMFFDDDVPSETMKRGLTLEQAQSHCQDKETSSSTCEGIEGIQNNQMYGKWFDAYTEEK